MSTREYGLSIGMALADVSSACTSPNVIRSDELRTSDVSDVSDVLVINRSRTVNSSTVASYFVWSQNCHLIIPKDRDIRLPGNKSVYWLGEIASPVRVYALKGRVRCVYKRVDSSSFAASLSTGHEEISYSSNGSVVVEFDNNQSILSYRLVYRQWIYLELLSYPVNAVDK